jgi:type II secretory pathway component PulF
MPTFAFSGRTRGGETVNGERAGDTMDMVMAALRREQILVTRITPAKEKAAGPRSRCGEGSVPARTWPCSPGSSPS